MDFIKWVFSAAVAVTVTVAGAAIAIGAMIFATVFKLLGIFTFIAGGIAILIKEKMDERSNKRD